MAAPAHPRIVERRVVGHLQPASVAKVAFAFSLTLSAILFVGTAALYLLGMASGTLQGLEQFIGSLGWNEFRIRFGAVLGIVVLVSLLLTAAITLLAVAFTVLYNVVTDIVGGVEIFTKER